MAEADFDPAQPMQEALPLAQRAGFRLHRFEVLNWGTFHQRVWRMQPGGDNLLLTGDIGSGKSTLVDALSTLLVAPAKLAYNKAAGADSRERSLRTYVLGTYKAERGESGMGARAVALRDGHSYSVILAVFHHECLQQTVTLAQVFWFKDPRGQPERCHVVADTPLSIGEHFSGFGSDIDQLKKRLRAYDGLALHESFPQYGADMRRRFGIASEQAMDLFHQTVSMKSVGNLTDFVRTHMLEAFPVENRIAALIDRVDELNRAHEAVLTARRQIGQLTPLVREVEEHAALHAQAGQLRACRDALGSWFTAAREQLLRERVGGLQAQLDQAGYHLQQLREERRELLQRRDDISRAVSGNGGGRIEQIKSDIERLQVWVDERTRRAAQYDALAHALGLPGCADAGAFDANRRAIEEGVAACLARRDEVQLRLTEAGVAVRELGRQYGAVTAELESLRQRGSNIPADLLALRAKLCAALHLSPDVLPFAGELMQVREEERAWEGACERVLHDFALSLLVPDVYYGPVADWIDSTYLSGRLAYCRVKATVTRPQTALHARALARKVAILPQSPVFDWMDAELSRRFDHACCDTLDQFRREPRAVTRNGQIKGQGERHAKDDRHRMDDRSRHVLGWSNGARVAALSKQERDLTTRVQASGAYIHNLKLEVDQHTASLDSWQRLALFSDFRELDWVPLVKRIDQLEREQAELAGASDALAALQQQFAAVTGERAALDEALEAAIGLQSRLAERCDQAQQAYARLDTRDAGMHALCFPLLDSLHAQAFGGEPLSVESCEAREQAMRELLQANVDGQEAALARLRDAVIGRMQDYCRAWPLQAREVDVSIEAGPEFARALAALENEELPRATERFRALLGENAVREIAAFQAQLRRDCDTVRDRIAIINASLHGIDYNPNRYIALDAEPALDADLRDFQQDLRACADGAQLPALDEAAVEARFLQVKRIIERLRGREGSAELDRRWTRKVTDVRNWFTFSASERWREDGREYEHYTDAGGKSGGQKEKLAYTVLAASLAYQFGLEQASPRARSLRFVVIDEAFGRGSDESARYGLELFRRMDLQLLVVTPLQKIHVIEPYVSGLGFVHSDDARQSMLRCLSVQQYQAERHARVAEPSQAGPGHAGGVRT